MFTRFWEFFSIALTTKSSSLTTTVCVTVCGAAGLLSVGVTTRTVSLTTLFIVWVMAGGACSRSVTVVMPVAIEVTKLTRSASKISCVLLRSSILLIILSCVRPVQYLLKPREHTECLFLSLHCQAKNEWCFQKSPCFCPARQRHTNLSLFWKDMRFLFPQKFLLRQAVKQPIHCPCQGWIY